MLQILLNLTRRSIRAFGNAREPNEEDRWRADPLSHPALRRMNAVELADLPIGHPVLMKGPCGS